MDRYLPAFNRWGLRTNAILEAGILFYNESQGKETGNLPAYNLAYT